MQIGATVSHYFGKYFRFKNSGVIFMVAGMAAGFAGLFGTPITAIFFALEVLVAGTLKYRAMSCAIPASFTAAYVSSLFGLHKSLCNPCRYNHKWCHTKWNPITLSLIHFKDKSHTFSRYSSPMIKQEHNS